VRSSIVVALVVLAGCRSGAPAEPRPDHGARLAQIERGLEQIALLPHLVRAGAPADDLVVGRDAPHSTTFAGEVSTYLPDGAPPDAAVVLDGELAAEGCAARDASVAVFLPDRAEREQMASRRITPDATIGEVPAVRVLVARGTTVVELSGFVLATRLAPLDGGGYGRAGTGSWSVIDIGKLGDGDLVLLDVVTAGAVFLGLDAALAPLAQGCG
jgi:hypothetical protein